MNPVLFIGTGHLYLISLFVKAPGLMSVFYFTLSNLTLLKSIQWSGVHSSYLGQRKLINNVQMLNQLIWLFQINCALPHRGCQCCVCKKFGIHLLFCKLLLQIQSEKTKKVWILSACVIFFFEIYVKIKIFVQKTWKSKTMFYQKQSGNPTSSTGEGKFCWNNPLMYTVAKW